MEKATAAFVVCGGIVGTGLSLQIFYSLMPRFLSEQFSQLDLLLTQYQEFWRFSPFHFTALPWADTEFGLHLQQITPVTIERLDQDETYRRSFFRNSSLN